MRTRLALAAAALAAATPIALAAPDALAAAASPVEPGTYEIVNARGTCLRGEGNFNSKTVVGRCDTEWEVTPSDDGSGFTVKHATTDNCLTTALEPIYPPFAATLPCGTVHGASWNFADADGGQVIIFRENSYLTDIGDNRPTVLLGPGNAGQKWILRRT
ncbi:hypothetical protein FHR32_001204 [Streptosporangium album]|uniref:Ricin B lectin domain-containing protein n=1 Tax=Streptosporangium album TaxID=47479 RepID=A0A7W7W8A6_9ACTN|nr:hypothetical protein [Streptosporangium album]MBB4936899.1 hypothetical protein [Streptosporangium album]